MTLTIADYDEKRLASRSAPDDPSVAELEAEFPGWYVWHGENGMWYARWPKSTPPLWVRDENTVELRARIASKIRMADGALDPQPDIRLAHLP